MERNTYWKPNEQGGDSVLNNANDWKSHPEPDLRKTVLSKIVEFLKRYFPNHSQNYINLSAAKFEDKAYGMSTDKNDYMRTIMEKMKTFETRFKNMQSNNVQSGSSVKGTNMPDPASQVLNQRQSLPTSMPYTKTATSQDWLPQNIQSNINILESSGLPTQVHVPISAAQNVNIQMDEGVHSNLLPRSQRQIQGSQQLLPQPQQQPHQSNYKLQHQMNQQFVKEKIRHANLRPPHMQQPGQNPQQQQSLLEQPIQQSFSQSSALSSLPSSVQQTSMQENSQFLPRHQFSIQRVHSSNQQQMTVLSQEQKQQEQEQLISQLMNGQYTQQNHLTTRQNNGEHQGDFRVSTSMQKNNGSFQHNDMHQHCLGSHGNNASVLPSQQQQHLLGSQTGNFSAPRTGWLGTQGQELGQSQPTMLQEYQPQHPLQQPQYRFQQNLDDTQRFQGSASLCQTQNIAYQQTTPPENSSTSQNSTGKTVNASSGDWMEETYQKIKALNQMYLPVVCTLLQNVVDKLRKIESLPPQKMLHEPTEKLRVGKMIMEQVIVFLNVHRSSISEKHRDRFSIFEDHILRLTKSQFGPRRPMQQQQAPLQSQSPQVHVSQSLDNNQMNSQWIPSNQNGASLSESDLTTSQTAMPHSMQTRPKMEPKYDNNIMASFGNVVLPSLQQISASNPQAVHSNISSVQSCMFQQPQQQQKQFHHRKMQQEPMHRQQQQQLPQQQANQQFQMPTSHQIYEMNDARMNIKAGLIQNNYSSSQCQIPKPLASPAQKSNFSPSASFPQIQHNSSPQWIDQQSLPALVNKTLQSGGSPFASSSHMTSFSPSFGGTIKSTLDFPVTLGAPLTLPPESEPTAEQPIDRLINAFQSSSRKSVEESVNEMSSVISIGDMIAGSFHSGGGSRAGLVEDFCLQEENLQTHEESNPTKRLKRSISTDQPQDIASQTDIYKQFSSLLETEVDSTASSGSKDNKIEPGCLLLNEINEINGRLVETVVDICEEVTSGIIVSCSYSPVTLSATFKAHYKSGNISQIQPLRLLVPANYPYSSPILVEKIPLDASVHGNEDLSARTRSKLSFLMKEVSEPVSLKDIVQMWNDCARATMTEYAERYGGGTFSSKYGTWETVLRAS